MNLRSKVHSLVSNPAMLPAYARWAGSKLFRGQAPRLGLPGGTQIGEWHSFSEYWSFQTLIPAPERLFVERCLATEARGLGTAFDVGANVGAFTCLMASCSRSVHSFEPVPETFCRLKLNVKFNGRLTRTHLNCLAVGREQGLVSFEIDEGAAAVNRMTAPGAPPGGGPGIQMIAVTDLDRYCQQMGIERIDLLKIDVEGMEPYVLQGASGLLQARKIGAILIEICPVNLRAVGLSPALLYREFEACRHLPHVLGEDGTPGRRLSLAEIEAMSLDNVVLLPDV